ncbi:uncharacterized protein I303_103874 [Kwoniella dejecticola CBS 10117]|uniref:XPG-I domain-containing protein n=1 Tax=Kwoniella dejecticola CBS 10117 TaxID=1296121 RepID=A0A1A6A7Y8_9TREE|nr:uncharacterized protein I303_03893 [Kwoniella dejecticola CBS 10117]OBR86173.1 hypothetical protein I303_03893 [Kwoniella dejecticola CBS 10117]
MGVPGLWELLRPAAARTSLSALAKESFQSNRKGLRAFTIGIDASIWIFHAQTTHYGENPFLRTIFFKITALLQHPVLPVFVFDGPNKPGQKRNQNVAGQFGTADHRSKQFKALLDVCGLEWWNAPGEAEAELAVMNRQGKIDAVLSDDVDALLFGATCLLRNNSPTLSGAQASTSGSNSARGDMRTYEVYRSSAIRDLWTKKEGTTLKTEEDCRMAMVFIALLGGGDYTPEGLPSIGPTISFGLANAGLSDFLKKYTSDRSTFEVSLPTIYDKIIEELRTNGSKQVGRRYPDRANKLCALSPTSVFPDFTLDAYLNPCTSPPGDLSQGWPGFGKGESSRTRGKARNEGRGDMEGLALACEKYFEWGTKEIVVKKFAGESVGIFGAELMNEARETIRSRSPPTNAPSIHQALGTSQVASTSMITSFFSQSAPSSSPILPKSSQSSQPVRHDDHDGEPPSHVLKIHSKRIDPTNPELNELRISFKHADYIRRCHGVMEGTRIDPEDLSDHTRNNIGLREKSCDQEEFSTPQAPVAKPSKDEIRVWIAEYLVKEAWPDLVQSWEDEKAAKRSPKKKPKTLTKAPPVKGRSKGKTMSVEKMNLGVFDAFFAAAKSPPRAANVVSGMESEEEIESIEHLPPRPNSRSKSRSVSASTPSSPKRSSPVPKSPRVAGVKTKPKARPCPTSSLSSLPESSPSRGPSPTSSAKNNSRPRSGSRSKPKSKSGSPKVPSVSPDLGTVTDEVVVLPTSPKQSKSTSPKKWPFSKRVFSKSKSSPSAFPSPYMVISKGKGEKDQPIDICSSSEDDLTPVRRGGRGRGRSESREAINSPSLNEHGHGQRQEATTPVAVRSTRGKETKYIEVAPSPPPEIVGSGVSKGSNILDISTRENTLSPVSRDNANSKAQTKTQSRNRTESILDSPVSTPTQSLLFSGPAYNDQTADGVIKSNMTENKTEKDKKKRTPSPKKKKKIDYVVVSETSDEEVLDCTRKK